MTRRLWPWLLVTLLWSSGARADLPSWLRKQNSDITDGNELLGKGDAKAALAAYDRAARELPDNPGVQLNRGVALLKLGELVKAKEALLSATGPTGSAEIRADAYRNLALAHYREAEASAGQNQHGPAQEAFRDSVDAAKRSLRLRPGDPNTAWNLELASRRMREEEAKEKAEQEKQKQDKKDEQQQGDQKPQDGDSPQDEKPGEDSKPPEDQQGDKQDGADQAKNDPAQDQDKNKDKNQDKQGQDAQQPPKPPQQQPKPSSAQDAQAGQEDKGKGEKPLPADVGRALDALQDSEQNFERVRARQRAQQERRAPEKDW